MFDIAAVIDWHGPFARLADAERAAKTDYDGGLYVVFGYGGGIHRGRPKLQYVGVGTPLRARLRADHHKLGRIERITGIWLGAVASYAPPGRRRKRIHPVLDIAEWGLIAFLHPCLNERKRTPPTRSFVLVNRWWKPDGRSPNEHEPRIWPDVIAYQAREIRGQMGWLTRRRVVELPDAGGTVRHRSPPAPQWHAVPPPPPPRRGEWAAPPASPARWGAPQDRRQPEGRLHLPLPRP